MDRVIFEPLKHSSQLKKMTFCDSRGGFIDEHNRMFEIEFKLDDGRHQSIMIDFSGRQTPRIHVSNIFMT